MSKHGDECRVPKLHVGLCDGCTRVAAERRRIIKEIVKPLMRCLADRRDYCFFNGDTFVHPFRDAADALLASVEAKLKEVKG